MLITATAGAGWGAPPVLNDNPLVVGQTTVQSRHITELRDAIDDLRIHLGMAAYSWQTPAAVGNLIKADPVVEMRTALDQALGAPAAPGYATGLAQGQMVRAVHIQELRDRVLARRSHSPARIEVMFLVISLEYVPLALGLNCEGVEPLLGPWETTCW